MSKLKIDIYFDIVCPWCLIGQHRLDKLLTGRFSHVDADIEMHPVLLVPDLPPQGVPIADILRARGVDPAAARERPQSEAGVAGLALDLSKQPMMYPTIAAHTLVRLARPMGTQGKLALALETAYFIEARNIADADVLADVAKVFGFQPSDARRLALSPHERDATLREAARAARQGIRGVPHFVFNGTDHLSGHQTDAALVEHIERNANVTASPAAPAGAGVSVRRA